VSGLGRRLGLAAALAPHWIRTAWLGLFRAHVGRPVEIVQGAVLREGEVLLTLRRDLRGWELPGGNLRPGEDPEDAARREVFEETGVEVALEGLSGTYHREGFLPHRARVYRCRPVGGAPTPSDETPRVAWWPVDALPGALLPWCRTPLADALAPRAKPVERRERQGLREILESARIDLRARWRGE
jgi:8-oxo-dGTP pyrophosphatase MutT (NUDIX family)